MDKYTKHSFFTALVLEIRASLYSTPSDAIFISKLSPFSETHRTLKNLEMIIQALHALKDRNGSSRQALDKYVKNPGSNLTFYSNISLVTEESGMFGRQNVGFQQNLIPLQ